MSNLQAREALERAQRLFRERPSAAIKNVPATAVWQDALKCKISNPEGRTVVTDMAKAIGGGDAGPSPGWLLRASLAACTATAIAMRAALNGIELRELEVTVCSDTDIRGAVGIDGVPLAMTGLRMSIKVGADTSAEKTLREIVAWASTQSTVSATLHKGLVIPVDVTMTAAPATATVLSNQ
jgi:uncharacterized OsmC-like protein